MFTYIRNNFISLYVSLELHRPGITWEAGLARYHVGTRATSLRGPLKLFKHHGIMVARDFRGALSCGMKELRLVSNLFLLLIVHLLFPFSLFLLLIVHGVLLVVLVGVVRLPATGGENVFVSLVPTAHHDFACRKKRKSIRKYHDFSYG